jgi:hypothetical protein
MVYFLERGERRKRRNRDEENNGSFGSLRPIILSIVRPKSTRRFINLSLAWGKHEKYVPTLLGYYFSLQ